MERLQALGETVQKNMSFVLVTIAIILGLSLLAKLAERLLPHIRKVSPAKRVSIIGICAAVAAVLHILDFPIPFIAPGFYKLDFSELPVLLAGFYLGPSAAVACEGVKILLKLLLKSTSTAFVGDFANFVVGCSFVLPAVIWYHAHKSKYGAVLGLILGTLVMTILGTGFNAVYLLPKFAELFYGGDMDKILSAGAMVNGNVRNIASFVVICVAPLNLLKGTVVSILTLLLYKRVARPLFGK